MRGRERAATPVALATPTTAATRPGAAGTGRAELAPRGTGTGVVATAAGSATAGGTTTGLPGRRPAPGAARREGYSTARPPARAPRWVPWADTCRSRPASFA